MARRKVAPTAAAPGAAALDAAREAIQVELAKRQRLPRAIKSLEDSLFPEQRAFVDDTALRVVAHTGRRGGKTFGLGARILRVARAFPGETIPVFERTQTCEAARVLWKTLQTINDEFQLGAEFHNSRMIMTLSNKAQIVIMGADTLEACDKARGGRYPAAFIDEAGTLRSHILDYLLKDVLEHALADFNGSLTMAGTPTPKCQGAFYEACNSSGWSKHRWTFFENTALPLRFRDGSKGSDHTDEERRIERHAMFADKLVRENLTGREPRVLREDFGEWHEDTDGLIYKLHPRNYSPAPPYDVLAPDLRDQRWRYLIGLDVGWRDPCAFVVVAWRRDQPNLWVLESEQHQEMLPDNIAAKLERLRLRYGAHTPVVMDCGGHGGKVIEELLAQKHGIRVVAARKRGKFDHIAFVNSDMVSGRLKILQSTNRDLIADLLQLRYAPPTIDGTVPEKEHPADDNHLPDALLYACTAITGIRKGHGDPDAPERGSAAWRVEQERRWLEADARAQRQRSGGSGSLDAALRLLD